MPRRRAAQFTLLICAVLWPSAGLLATALPPCPPDISLVWHECYGTFYFKSGGSYEGEWRDDDFNGFGTYIWSEGDKYIGEWRDGQRHGKGTYIFEDGEVIKGNFYNDEFIKDDWLFLG
jgi:hypothetical protein